MRRALLKNIVFFVGLYAYQAHAEVLGRDLRDLYVFSTPDNDKTEEDDRRLEIVLTLNSYQGKPGIAEIVGEKHFKYEIYIGDSEYSVLRRFEVVLQQSGRFAVRVTGENNVLTGRIGEYVSSSWFKFYVGRRADPAFFDLIGFEEFLKDLCDPQVGLRCSGADEVQNYFQNKNVLSFALSLLAKDIVPNDVVGNNTNKFKIWAKAFAEQD